MIVNICGTSGAGKSTTIRRLLAYANEPEVETVYEEGRRAPLGYVLHLPEVGREVFLVGAYEVGTGGCDTIKDVEKVYSLIEAQHDLGRHVVYEGLFVMNMTRGPVMIQRVGKENVAVIRLSTELPECKRSVNERRAVQGKEPMTEWKNTEGNYVRARNFSYKMRDWGAAYKLVTRDEALPTLLELLR